MESERDFSEANQKHQPLKIMYPLVERRAEYAQNLLRNMNSTYSFVIRVEPFLNYYHDEGVKYLTFIACDSALIAQIYQILYEKLKLPKETKLYLTLNHRVLPMNAKISEIAEKGKESDGIIYLEYGNIIPYPQIYINNKFFSILFLVILTFIISFII